MMKLNVLMNGELAGTLSYMAQTHRYAFDYSPAWLSRKARYALGTTLPLEVDEALTEERHSAFVRQFFENLLPEGQALDDAASTHKVSKGNLMGLLAALGGETAGALQLRLPGTDVTPAAATRRPLSHAELSARIRARPFHPFSVWDGRVRLSIAGFQDKIAVFEEGGQWALVEGGQLASTHILKPEPVTAQLAGLTGNEYFCMRLAHWAKLPVAEVALVHVPEPVLVVKRFDRELAVGRVALPPGEHRACPHGPAGARQPAKGLRGCAGRRGGARTHRALAHLGRHRVRASGQHGTRCGEGRSINFLSLPNHHAPGRATSGSCMQWPPSVTHRTDPAAPATISASQPDCMRPP